MSIEDDQGTGVVGWAVAAWGGIAAVLWAPVAAALLCLLYRFPIPFGDFASGLAEAGNAGLASVYYLVMGEGPVLFLLGAAAGYYSARTVGPRLIRGLALAVVAGFGLAFLGALLLAVTGLATGS